MKDIFIVIYKRGNDTRVSSECYDTYEGARGFCLSRDVLELTPTVFTSPDDPTVVYIIKTLSLKKVK